MSFSTRTTYQGKAVNQGTRAILDAANKLLTLPKYGGETGPLTLVQGSYSGGVVASAGTHNGGGAIDITAYNWENRIIVFRMLGVAMWRRTAIRNLWGEHMHGIVCGDGSASDGAKTQVREYYAGGDGLAGSGRDPNWRPVVFPLFVLPTSAYSNQRYYLKAERQRYGQPSTGSAKLSILAKGSAYIVVAIVNVKGSIWAAGSTGGWVPYAHLSKTALAAPRPVASAIIKKVAQYKVTSTALYGYEALTAKKVVNEMLSRGDVFTSQAYRTVNGNLWVQRDNGNWFDGKHLNLFVKPVATAIVKKVAQYEVMSVALYGYEALTANKVIRETLHRGDVFTSQAYRTVNGGLWVQRDNDSWFDGKHLDLVVVPSPQPPAPPVAETNLRPMTYNVPDSTKLSNVAERVLAAAALVNSGNPTFVMVQEAVGLTSTGRPSSHAKAIDAALGPKWWVIQPTLSYNENYTWYDSTALILVEQYPDEVLTSAGGGRHITRGVFKHKISGLVFAVGNTHFVNDHGGVQYEESRQSQGVQAMRAMADVRNRHGQCPIVIGGDFNTTNLIKGFLDGGLQNVAIGAAETANLKYQSYAKISDITPNLGKQIDQLYASKAFTMRGLNVLLGLQSNGSWPPVRPSDHVPVLGSITI